MAAAPTQNLRVLGTWCVQVPFTEGQEGHQNCTHIHTQRDKYTLHIIHYSCEMEFSVVIVNLVLK